MDKEYIFKLDELKILYINLDRRPDRKQNIQNELSRLGLKGTRISAVDGKTFSPEEQDYWMDRKNFNTLSRIPERVFGRVGCYLSHLKALKYALENRIEPLLILEDDCRFLTERSDVEIRIPKNCDMYYLGGLYWWKDDQKPKDDYTFENIRSDYFYQPYIRILPSNFRIACTFAYILPTLEHVEGMFRTLLNVKKKAVDMMYVTYIQKYENSFIIQPSLCIQSDDYTSDITDYGNKTPTNPFNNSYFFDINIYTVSRVLEFYNSNYPRVLRRLLKYYYSKKISPDPKKLFQHLRIVSKEKIMK